MTLTYGFMASKRSYPTGAEKKERKCAKNKVGMYFCNIFNSYLVLMN